MKINSLTIYHCDDIDGLNVLNLLDGKHSVLNRIALLLQYRTFNLNFEIAINASDYIIKHYSSDISDCDIEDLLENPMA